MDRMRASAGTLEPGCPAENTWQRFVHGALEPASAGALELHLDGCASCRFLFANLAGDTTRALPAPVITLSCDELVRGTLVDRYVVLGTLGRGGMGVVYKAFDPQLDRPVALKLVAVTAFGSEADAARARLLREAKLLAQLSHPNVVAVHDVGTHGDDVFVAMEFVAGTTLRRWLEAPRSPRETLAVFRAAGAGLAAAHRRGIVHRDFKPENVIVGDDGRVRVLDFGLARTREAVARPSLPIVAAAPDSPALTHAGAIMGTPAYMAPEQDRGEPVDGRTDQFSFCAVLYEALFGQRPFAGSTYHELARHRLAGERRDPPSTRGVSARVRGAVLTGLAHDPGARHRSMDELLVELGDARRRRVKLALAAVALAGLGAGGWGAYVAMHAPPSADELCEQSRRELDRVWNAERRADIFANLGRLGVPDGHATATRIAAGVDRFARAWGDRRVATCKLELAGSSTGEPRAANRLQCLEGALDSLDGVVSVFTHAPNSVVVARADHIVAELALPACDGSGPTELVTEARRDLLQPLLQDLVDGNVALGAGDVDTAARLATNVVAQARERGEREPLAASLLLLGQAQARNGAHDAAMSTLREAVQAATEVREEDMVVDAWLEMIEMAFTDRRLLAGIEHAIFAAELAAARLPANSPAHAKLAYKVGSVQVLRGEMADAIRRLAIARADLAKDPDEHRYDLATIDTSLGIAHLYLGHDTEARALLAGSHAVWATLPVLHPNLATSEGWLGELAVLAGDAASAERHFTRAVAILEEVGSSGRSQLAKMQFQLGMLYARGGRCAEARPVFARAKAAAAEVFGATSAAVGLALLGEGTCALAAGRRREAIALLERAMTLAAPAPALMFQIPLTQFALARAISSDPAQRAQAVALAEQARAAFARLPGTRVHREAVEAWLAQPR